MQNDKNSIRPPDISEKDIIEAMKMIPGYLDITPGDFKQIYEVAATIVIDRYLHSLTAEKLMTKKVCLLQQSMPLVQATSILAENHISGAPVVDDNNKIVGIISEKDFLNEMGLGKNPSFMQIISHWLQDKNLMVSRLQDNTVAQIMTKSPIVGSPEMTMSEISNIFAERKINRLPIIDENGLIAGIVTRTHLAHAYHNMTGEQQK